MQECRAVAMLSCEHEFWMGSYQIWDFWLHGELVCMCVFRFTHIYS